MAEMKRYGKPSLTNLPSDLGMMIFQQIRNTPRPDEAAMQKKRDEIMAEIDAVLARDYAEGDSVILAIILAIMIIRFLRGKGNPLAARQIVKMIWGVPEGFVLYWGYIANRRISL